MDIMFQFKELTSHRVPGRTSIFRRYWMFFSMHLNLAMKKEIFLLQTCFSLSRWIVRESAYFLVSLVTQNQTYSGLTLTNVSSTINSEILFFLIDIYLLRSILLNPLSDCYMMAYLYFVHIKYIWKHSS
jgi:hypothetical protein